MSDMKQIFGSDSENEENNSAEHNEEQVEEEAAHEETEEAQGEEEHEEEGEENGQDSEVKEPEEETEEPEAGTPAAENAEEEAEEEEEHHAEEEEREEHDADEEDDDDDEVVRPKKDEKTAEVFGDELADLSDDDDDDSNKEADELKASQNQEDHEEEEPEQVIDIEIPRFKTDLGKDIHFVKLPNFLSVVPRPFDPQTYEDENPKGEALDEEGKTRVRLKVENTIRWRYEKDEEENLVKQSNAKIVKWSDGSLSLHLGNEIFDVSKLAMHGDHNHLFVRQGNVLQGQAVFRTKLAFRPHSTDSMTHRKMTMSLVDSGSRTKKVKIISEFSKNPEKDRVELIKKEEEKLRAASRRQNQQRRMREKSHQKGLSANYLEDRYNSDDDDAGISLSAIKNRFKNRNDTIDSSSDESDRERRLNKAKNDDDDEEDNDYAEDDDDLGSSKPGHGHGSAQKKKKKMVVSDDED